MYWLCKFIAVKFEILMAENLAALRIAVRSLIIGFLSLGEIYCLLLPSRGWKVHIAQVPCFTQIFIIYNAT